MYPSYHVSHSITCEAIPKDLPMEVIFEIIEQFAIPSHPLAYDFEPLTLKTLLSFTLVCNATHPIATSILYSRVCIESVQQMRRLSQAGLHNLNRIRSLYISIMNDEVEEELNTRLSTDPSVHSPSERDRLAEELDCHIAVTLSDLLRSMGPALARLVIGCSDSWEAWLDLPHEISKDCVAGLAHAIIAITPQLSELVVLRKYPRLYSDNSGQPGKNLRRLALCENHLQIGSSTAPNLEYLCLIDGFLSLPFFYDHALKKDHSIRKVLLVWSGIGRLKRRLLHVDEFEDQTKWSVRANHPVETATVDIPRGEDEAYEVGKLAKSGLLWDMK